jgi:CheY-like chemotaxis protein
MPVRFLIADDVPAQQKLLANVILYLGGESRFASNGREALRLAQAEMFDIVLLDLSMPELGGVAAANRLIDGWSALMSRPRIVAVTGETDEGSRTLCRAVGMDGFIPKPFGMGTVRKALKNLIVQGHCWPEGPARRILDVGALKADSLRHDSAFDREVLETRTSLQELVEKLDTLTPEQCIEKSEFLASFARRYGLLQLAPVMETFIKAAREGRASHFTAQLAEQRGDFEHAIIALRSWHHHAPEPLRLSA